MLLPAGSPVQGASRLALGLVSVPAPLYVGDRFQCTVIIRHPKGYTASLRGLEAAFRHPFELIARKHRSRQAQVGKDVEEIYDLELALFAPGKRQFPTLTVELLDATGRHAGAESFRPVNSVTVQTLTDPGFRQFRPLRPPQMPPLPLQLLFMLVVVVGGFAVLVLFVVYALKRLVQRHAEDVDSGQVAQRKLRRLGSSLSAGMPPRECYEELSTILRIFLEKQYRIIALEAVTQEIERDLKKLGVAGFETIVILLRQADLVKFADCRPDMEESRQSLDTASEAIRSAPAVDTNNSVQQESVMRGSAGAG